MWAGGRLAHEAVVAMTAAITSRTSEGPLGDAGSERAKACVSAPLWRSYYHAKERAGSLLLPKAIANHWLARVQAGEEWEGRG